MTEQTGSTVFSLPTDFDEIVEDQPVEANWYDVVVKKAELKESKESKRPMISLVFDIEGADESTPAVFLNLVLPYEGCHKIMKQNLKRFIQTFDVPIGADGSVDIQALPGLRANVWLEKKIGFTGREQNEIKLQDIA